jgi:hypothetical protein
MATAPNLYKAAEVVSGTPLVMALFRFLLREGTASGWTLADHVRSQGSTPSDVLDRLQMLKEEGIVESQGSDLAGYYYVTSKGRLLRQFLPE